MREGGIERSFQRVSEARPENRFTREPVESWMPGPMGQWWTAPPPPPPTSPPTPFWSPFTAEELAEMIVLKRAAFKATLEQEAVMSAARATEKKAREAKDAKDVKAAGGIRHM